MIRSSFKIPTLIYIYMESDSDNLTLHMRANEIFKLECDEEE